MPHRLLPLLLLFSACTARPAAEATADARAAQEKLNREYLDPDHSILSSEQRAALAANGGLNFFPIDESYAVVARLERYPDPETVSMPTSGDRPAEFLVYGRLLFKLQGRPDTLDVFRSTNRFVPEEYRDLLFVPFRDATSGDDTYGGGRYLDLRVPDGDRVAVDFNKAYHPYCAYTTGYNCPVPPRQNYLEQRVEAGVKNTPLP